MRSSNTIIFDLTGEKVSAGIIGDAPGELMMLEEFAPDLRVALGRVDGQIRAWMDAQSHGIPERLRSLVFDHLNDCLPRIEDEDLQSLIVAALWRYLGDGCSERGLIAREARTRAYVIVQNHPAPALERFRTACATEERINLAAFPNEAASLVMGAIESGEVRDVAAADCLMPAPVCLIVAYTDRHIEVCSFELMMVGKTKHRIFIRDFFRTGSADLAAELQNRHVFEDLRLAVLFESSKLSERSQKSLQQAVRGPSWKTALSQRPLVELLVLKMRGAAHLVRETEGWSGRPVEYDIETAFNIGFRAEGERFQSVFTQDELRGAVRYPVASSGAFRFHPRPANDVVIRACCGYSNRVEESTTLGELTIPRPDIDEIFRHKRAVLSMQIRLESAGKGEFSLGILPTGRTIGSQTFTIPSLMA